MVWHRLYCYRSTVKGILPNSNDINMIKFLLSLSRHWFTESFFYNVILFCMYDNVVVFSQYGSLHDYSSNVLHKMQDGTIWCSTSSINNLKTTSWLLGYRMIQQRCRRARPRRHEARSNLRFQPKSPWQIHKFHGEICHFPLTIRSVYFFISKGQPSAVMPTLDTRRIT